MGEVKGTIKGHRKLLEVMKLFIFLTVKMALQVYAYDKTSNFTH